MVSSAIEFLERAGQIKRIRFGSCNGACKGCQGCGETEMLGSLPVMWEVIKKEKH